VSLVEVWLLGGGVGEESCGNESLLVGAGCFTRCSDGLHGHPQAWCPLPLQRQQQVGERQSRTTWSEAKQLKHLPRACSLNFSIPRSVTGRWLAPSDELEYCCSFLHQYGPLTSVQVSGRALLWVSAFHGPGGGDAFVDSSTHFSFSTLVYFFGLLAPRIEEGVPFAEVLQRSRSACGR